MDWRASMARTCTSTPTRARDSIRNGAAPSSTTAAPKCATSSPAARCSGSTSTTSMRCAWTPWRSEEHTSELQSRSDLVCRLLLEKKKKIDSPQDDDDRNEN